MKKIWVLVSVLLPVVTLGAIKKSEEAPSLNDGAQKSVFEKLAEQGRVSIQETADGGRTTEQCGGGGRTAPREK